MLKKILNIKSGEKLYAFLAFLSLSIGMIVLGCFTYFIWQNFSVAGGLSQNNVMENTGNVGDFLGGAVGSFWALTGVFLLYLTLKMQREELKNQRIELQNTREIFEVQKFENTFFNLLEYQNSINSSLKIYTNGMKLERDDFKFYKNENHGDEVFLRARKELLRIQFALSAKYFANSEDDMDYLENELGMLIQKEEEEQKTNTDDRQSLNIKVSNIKCVKQYKISQGEFDQYKKMTPFEQAKLTYAIFFERYENVFGHYFRNLYHIIKYLDETKTRLIKLEDNPTEKDKIEVDFLRYSQFIQSQMTSAELLILFYNTINFPKMSNYVKMYNLLENLSSDLLLDSNHNGAEGIYLGKNKKNIRLELVSAKDINS